MAKKQNVSTPAATIAKLRSGQTVTIKPASAVELLRAMEEMRSSLLSGKEVAEHVVVNATYENQPEVRKQANLFVGSAITSAAFMKEK